MRLPTALKILLSERLVLENEVTDIQVNESAITVSVVLRVNARRLGSDSVRHIHAVPTDSQHMTVQGLGLQGRALRYNVTIPYFAAANGRHKIARIPWPVPGIYVDWQVTDEVLAKAVYLANCGQSPDMIAQLLGDLYGVETNATRVKQWLSDHGKAQHPLPARIAASVPV
jgi:hypothetical protein